MIDNEVKRIIDKILNAGFKAYIVGGYVRDYCMHISSYDVDIATSALPKDLKKIFNEDDVKVTSYGSLKINIDKYNFDITTFRKDLQYAQNKLVQVEYVDNIQEDIYRRDFTINSLYMDKDGKIIDLVGGLKDLRKRVIRLIGDNKTRLNEDSTRALRAIRFMITLDFTIDNKLLKYLIAHKDEIKFNNNILKEELNKMLLSKNVVKYFNYLKKKKLLSLLKVDFNNLIYVEDINGMYAQLEFSEELPFTKEEKEHIKDIKQIVKYAHIDYGVLFKYDLYNCIVAGEILQIDKKTINIKYNQMPIQNLKQLAINGDEICQILKIEPSKVVKKIIDTLVFLILNNEIQNDNAKLKEYVSQKKEQWLDEFI